MTLTVAADRRTRVTPALIKMSVNVFVHTDVVCGDIKIITDILCLCRLD